MQSKAVRPKSAVLRTSPEVLKVSTTSLDSAAQVHTEPSEPTFSQSLWKGLFRPQSAASERRYCLSRSFLASSLHKPGPATERITLSPGKQYEMQMLSNKSQRLLRQRFRPQAKINAYLMYVSATELPQSADSGLELSPQPYTKAELNAIRKAPSVEKMLKAARRGAKETRDRTVRKSKVDFLKVPILDGTLQTDTSSDEERELEAVKVMEGLHLRFTTQTTTATDRSEAHGTSVSVASVESISIEPSGSRLVQTEESEGMPPRPKTAFLSKYYSKASIPETEEDTFPRKNQSTGLIPRLRLRPASAYVSSTLFATEKQEMARSWRQPDPPLSPYAIKVRGGKVREQRSRGVMFRPVSAQSEQQKKGPFTYTVIRRTVHTSRVN